MCGNAAHVKSVNGRQSSLSAEGSEAGSVSPVLCVPSYLQHSMQTA